MAAILLGITLSVLDSTILNLALPDITRHFGASPAASVWVVNAYQLATLALLLPCANLGDRIGYRRVYIAGVVIFTVASIACLLAPSLPLLAAARAMQGVGAAGMFSVNGALVRLTYPVAVLGRGIALNSMVVATASVAGPTVAALVLSVASWRWLFVIQVPLALLVLVLAQRALPRNAAPAAAPGPKWLDVFLNMATFSLVFLAADMLGARRGATGNPHGAWLGGAMMAAGLLLAWIYIRRQARQPLPLFPVDLLRIRLFALSMCTSVTAFAAQTLAFVGLPFLLLEGQGRSHFEAGLLLTAWPAATIVAAPVAGRMIHRFGGGLLGGVGLGLLAIGLASLAWLPAEPAGWQVALSCAVCGAGFGLFQSPNNHTIVTSAPLSRSGAASGMLGTARLTGQSLGVVLLALIFTAVGIGDGGTDIALGLAAALAATAAAFSLLRTRARRE
jgi:DHA2 family multidrug resistance protein-like MFS transporter